MTTTEKLVLSILRASEDNRGGLVGTIQLRKDDGEIIYESSANVSKSEDRARVIEDLEQLGLVSANRELMRSVALARDSLKKKAAADDLDYADPKRKLQADKLIAELAEGGTFYRAPGGFYYFNGVTKFPIEVSGFEMSAVLWQKWGINETDRLGSYMRSALRYHASDKGTDADIHSLAYYDASTNKAYIDQGDGRVLVCDGKKPLTVENGTDGVLFRPANNFAAWEYTPAEGDQGGHVLDGALYNDFIGAMSFDDEGPMDADDQRFMTLIWLVALFFRSELPTKPILLCTGPSHSGKTSAARAFGQLLLGPRFQVMALNAEKEDDFNTTITNVPFAAFDNLDYSIRWLKDALARAATGADIPKRVLRTTNEYITLKADCFLALTAHSPKFRQTDVVERMLILNFKRLGLMKAESFLQRELAGRRNAYMSELADVVNGVIATPASPSHDSPLRLADFYNIGLRIGASLGERDRVVEVFERMKLTQHGFASEENVLIRTLAEWVGRSPAGRPNAGTWVAAQVLYKDLRAIATELDWFWNIANENALGMRILRDLDLIDTDFVIQRSKKTKRGRMYRVFEKDPDGNSQTINGDRVVTDLDSAIQIEMVTT